MCCACGDEMVISLVIETMRQEARDLSIARVHLSLWVDKGLRDVSCALHSTGMSYWNVLGTLLGYDAIGELPAPHDGPYAFVGEDVRSDSVWFEATSHQPHVLIEFERYTGKTDESKLVGKVDNLLLAHHRWGQQPAVLILSYWTKGLASLPDHALLRRRVQQGFMTSAKEQVEGSGRCQIFFFQTVLQQTAEDRWRLSQVIERGIP
jgi:hypothetical protein